LYHKFLNFIDYWEWFFINLLFNYYLLNYVFSDNRPLYNHRYHLWYTEWNLHLNTLNFSIIYVYLLIFNTIPISWYWHLSNNLMWNSFLDLNFNNLLFFHNFLYDFIDLYNLNLFYIFNNLFFDNNFNYLFHLLNYGLWNLYFNDLKDWDLNKNDFFDYFRNLYNFLDNPWNNYYLFNNSFNLNYSRDLHYFLYNLLNYLLLNSHHFFFNYHRNRFFNMYLFYYLLFYRYYFTFFNLKLFYFLSTYRNMHFSKDWYLLSNITRHNLFDLNVSACHNLMNDWFINKALNFFYYLNLISLNEMRPLNINLFGYLFDEFLFFGDTDLFNNFF
jgi:hypothetical protein